MATENRSAAGGGAPWGLPDFLFQKELFAARDTDPMHNLSAHPWQAKMANLTYDNITLSNHSEVAIQPPTNYKTVELVFIATVTGSLSLVTVVGNILVMLSIKVNRQLQTVNNYFLFSLACADLIIGVFSMNLYTVYIIKGYWPLGAVVCDLWLALDYVFIVGKRTVHERECYIQFLSNPAVTFGTAIAAFYLPVVIMTVLYIHISLASRSRNNNNSPKRAVEVKEEVRNGKVDDQPSAQTEATGQQEEKETSNESSTWSKIKIVTKQTGRPANVARKFASIARSQVRKKRQMAAREKKVTRTIFAILLAFILTWTPYNVMVLINTFCETCVPETVWSIGYWLCYVNSTINPACYALCNATFKKTFKHLLMCQYRNIGTAR
ncbi:UNVERIFIED_CONTAM: hypothetical protein H355_007948 [Colinus virginianus]|nr:hypothetical protein H355_007948 [Colinus virginianus]